MDIYIDNKLNQTEIVYKIMYTDRCEIATFYCIFILFFCRCILFYFIGQKKTKFLNIFE